MIKSKEQYMIYGSVDNGSPNVEIFFMTESKDEVIKVYKKIERLSDLVFPETPILKKEHDELVKDLLNNHGVQIWADEDNYADFDLNIAEFKGLKMVDLK